MALDAAFRILKYLEGPGYDDAGDVPPEVHEEWDEEDKSKLPEVSRLIGGLSDEDLQELQRRLALSPTTKHIFGSDSEREAGKSGYPPDSDKAGWGEALPDPRERGVGVTKYKSDREQNVGAPP